MVVTIIMVTQKDSHQSYSHQVGICHNDEGWEYDTVNFPPYLYNDKYNDKGVRGVVRLDECNHYDTHQMSSRHLPNIARVQNCPDITLLIVLKKLKSSKHHPGQQM